MRPPLPLGFAAVLCALVMIPACAKGPASTAPRSGVHQRPHASGGPYRLVLHRPDRVGQRFRNIRTGSQVTRYKVDGHPVAELTKKLRYSCDGIETVLAVTRTGLARKVSYLVSIPEVASKRKRDRRVGCALPDLVVVPGVLPQIWWCADGVHGAVAAEVHFWDGNYLVNRLRETCAGKTTDLLPPGAIVVAEELPGVHSYTVRGIPLAAAARRILISCHEITALEHPTDDEYLGSATPRRPKETWPVNRPKFLESMNHEIKGLRLNPRPRDVIGRVTLLGPARIAGVRALRYRVFIHVKNFAPYIQSVVARQGSMRIEIDGWVAQDPRDQTRGRRLTMTSHFLGTLTQDGQTRAMEYGYTHRRTEHRTPLR